MYGLCSAAKREDVESVELNLAVMAGEEKLALIALPLCNHGQGPNSPPARFRKLLPTQATPTSSHVHQVMVNLSITGPNFCSQLSCVAP